MMKKTTRTKKLVDEQSHDCVDVFGVSVFVSVFLVVTSVTRADKGVML